VGKAFHESGEYARQGLENTVSDKGPLYNTSGPLQYALGSMGQAFSPLTGAAMSAGQAATQLTGNPDFGNRVELVGGLIDPSHAGALKTAARAAHEVAPAIIPIAAAKKLSTETSLPKTNEFALAVKNTPGARIEDDRLVLPLTRNQRPEQSGAESVRGGVFYLPEGSPNQKYYTGSGFNIGYGGSEPIKGETALANPLFVKGATGGKAPEAAYVQLKGKDAFKDMQDDVYRSIGAYYLDKDTKRELVQQFLDKHAPDLSNHADYILKNSSKGNQLRYALQEAAVAQAARDAGHDAVVGYSMSRKTKEPFISEVFDVRENRYPTKSGEYGVWPKFEAAEPQMGLKQHEPEGYLAHDDPSHRQNFENWFGDSVVKNQDGTPKTVYHGSGADFSVFRPSKTGEFGPGVYATDLADEASSYAGTHPEGMGQNVMPVHIRMEQPFVAKNPSDFWDAFGGKTDTDAMLNAQKAGYDGVIIERPYTIYDDKRKQFYQTGQTHTHYVVFDPKQIKSAIGNKGTYDLKSPKITEARGGTIPFGPEAAQRAVQIAKQQAGRR